MFLGFFRGVWVAQSSTIRLSHSYRNTGNSREGEDMTISEDSRLETPNNMTLILVLILSMSGMIMWVMFHMTMALCSCSVMGSIMRWDMGGVILIYGYTMFFEYLLIRTRAREGTYGSSMFFGFCADLLLVMSIMRLTFGLWSALSVSWRSGVIDLRFISPKLPILVLFLLWHCNEYLITWRDACRTWLCTALSSPRQVKEDTQYRHRRHQNLLFVQFTN